MTNLIIDIRNTRIKTALFERKKLVEKRVFDGLEFVLSYCKIDENNSFRGGDISSGVGMRTKSMHDQTARLPLIDLKVTPNNLISKNTITCTQIGFWYSFKLELQGQIEAYTKKFPKIEVFVNSRDAQSFDSLAKDLIFVVPNLVLYGLNSILNHNVE